MYENQVVYIFFSKIKISKLAHLSIQQPLLFQSPKKKKKKKINYYNSKNFTRNNARVLMSYPPIVNLPSRHYHFPLQTTTPYSHSLTQHVHLTSLNSLRHQILQSPPKKPDKINKHEDINTNTRSAQVKRDTMRQSLVNQFVTPHYVKTNQMYLMNHVTYLNNTSE